MIDQENTSTTTHQCLRHIKAIVKYLATLALGVSILVAISFAFDLHSYCSYWSQTAKLRKAQSLKVYFDDQLKQDVPAEDIPLYVREICKGREFHWGSACPFTIKLVFSFPDKPTYDVLIGTDGCKQLRLPSGMQAKFPYDGKLTELDKEYQTSQNKSPQGGSKLAGGMSPR